MVETKQKIYAIKGKNEKTKEKFFQIHPFPFLADEITRGCAVARQLTPHRTLEREVLEEMGVQTINDNYR